MNAAEGPPVGEAERQAIFLALAPYIRPAWRDDAVRDVLVALLNNGSNVGNERGGTPSVSAERDRRSDSSVEAVGEVVREALLLADTCDTLRSLKHWAHGLKTLATEVRRLQAELAQQTQNTIDWHQSYLDGVLEIERLQAALAQQSSCRCGKRKAEDCNTATCLWQAARAAMAAAQKEKPRG